MLDVVSVPFWLIFVTGLLAVVALLDRLIVPGVSWVFRQRARKAIEELNTRLKIHIRPFKSTRRKVLIDALLQDPQVQQAIEQHVKDDGVTRESATRKAQSYAKEIVPSFSSYAYFRVATRWAKRLSQMLYRVRLGYTNDDALRTVDPDSSVVFVINHRSNLDYVLVTYIAASSSALSYAVGEWASTWPLSSLIRSMGAYFVRRNATGDALYRKILARYVHMATQSGVVQAVFPEGGLSRDGTLGPAKLGLLSYMVSGFDPSGPRDVVFIPVGVNYDRVLEDRVLTSAADRKAGDRTAFRFRPWSLFSFLMNSVWLAIRGRWYRYGYACVSFGEPISLRSYLNDHAIDLRTLQQEQRSIEIERIGVKLMDAVGRAVPAVPVSLVATVMLVHKDRSLTKFELMGGVHALIRRLESSGAYTHIPRADREYAIEVGLRMLTLRHFIVENDGTYSANPKELTMLRYYANSIAHLVEPG